MQVACIRCTDGFSTTDRSAQLCPHCRQFLKDQDSRRHAQTWQSHADKVARGILAQVFGDDA